MQARENLLVRNRNFRLVWAGQVLSQAGSRAYFINLLWWIVTTSSISGESADSATSAAWASGILLVLMGLPSVLMMKVIGRTLSRYPTKKILVGFELCGAALSLVLFGLAATDRLDLGWTWVLSGLIAICQSFVDPALVKAVPELVDEADIERAVGFESATQAIAFFSGAALGAIASGTLGFVFTIGLNALSYLASALMTLGASFRVNAQPQSASEDLAHPDTKAVALPPDVPPLLRAFGLANLFMFPLFLILPLFVSKSLGGSVITLGVLEACFWLGLVAGAASAGLVPVISGDFLRTSAALFFFFGGMLASVALLASQWWVGLVLLAGGASAGILNVKVVTYFQNAVPETLRGNFFARLQAWVTGVQPASYLLFTFVLTFISPQHGFAACGVGLVATGAYCWMRSRKKHP